MVGHFERKRPDATKLLHQTLNDDRLKENENVRRVVEEVHADVRNHPMGRVELNVTPRKSRNTLPPVVALTKNKRK